MPTSDYNIKLPINFTVNMLLKCQSHKYDLSGKVFFFFFIISLIFYNNNAMEFTVIVCCCSCCNFPHISAINPTPFLKQQIDWIAIVLILYCFFCSFLFFLFVSFTRCKCVGVFGFLFIFESKHF